MRAVQCLHRSNLPTPRQRESTTDASIYAVPRLTFSGSRDRCFSSQSAFGEKCCGRTISCGYHRQFLAMKWNNPSGAVDPPRHVHLVPELKIVAQQISRILLISTPKSLISSHLNTTGFYPDISCPGLFFQAHHGRAKEQPRITIPNGKGVAQEGQIVALGPRPSCPPQ